MSLVANTDKPVTLTQIQVNKAKDMLVATKAKVTLIFVAVCFYLFSVAEA